MIFARTLLFQKNGTNSAKRSHMTAIIILYFGEEVNRGDLIFCDKDFHSESEQQNAYCRRGDRSQKDTEKKEEPPLAFLFAHRWGR